MGSKNEIIMQMDTIGSVKFKRSARARNLTIRIKPHTGVLVSMPNGISLEQAKIFVKSKSAWITRNLRKVQMYEQQSVIYDGTGEICTRFHLLQVEAGDYSVIRVRLDADKIIVRYPRKLTLTSSEVQNAIHFGLTEAWRKEAKAYLPQRVTELAGMHGFTFRKVFIKNHRSRWGSCSEVNNINLNLHLMRLPDKLVDYVILHELVHTEIKNHSPAFWKRVEQIRPDMKELRKQLKQHHI